MISGTVVLRLEDRILPALVEAETPVRLHRGLADDVRVLLGHLGRAGAGEEVVVHDTAERVVLEELAALLGVVDDDVHAVGVHEEHSVGTGLPLLDVEGVAAVDVGAGGHAKVVEVPERAEVISRVEPEVVRVLAETVQVRVIGEAGPEAHVLRLEDQGRGRGVEKDLLGVGADDGEGEGLLRVLEPDVALIRQAGPLRSGDDGLRDLVDLVPLVLDLDVEAVLWCRVLAFLSQGKTRQVGTHRSRT